jgi:hypothetical protein
MPTAPRRPLGLLLGMIASIASMLSFAACEEKQGATGTDAAQSTSAAVASAAPTSSATGAVSASTAATVDASAAAKTAALPSAPAHVECRARNEAGLVELALTWDRNTAKGTLTVGGHPRPVIAELYKGLVLVDAPGTTPVTGKQATLTTEGKKTIRVGDYKQPTFDCL